MTNKLFIFQFVLAFFVCCSVLCSCNYTKSANFTRDYSDTYRRYEYSSLSLQVGELRGRDIELFRNTPVWQIAKAVYEQDTVRIYQYCQFGSAKVNFKEPKYGLTLLSWAIINKRFFAARTLLTCGANPHLSDKNGISPIFYAATNEYSSEYLKLLLRYGADPNSKNQIDSNLFFPVICDAVATNIKNTEILVEAGADINYTSDGVLCAFSEAVRYDINIAEYLIRKGAIVNRPAYVRISDTLYAIDMIKEAEYMSDSASYVVAQRVLKFLREHGADSSLK